MSLLDGQGSGSNQSGMVNEKGEKLELWNYANETDKDGNKLSNFKEEVEGTVVNMMEVQATKYQSNEPEWWTDEHGNITGPKMDIEIAIHQDDGEELAWHIKPGSAKRYEKMSVARRALVDIVRTITKNPNTIDLTKLIGKRIRVSTYQCKLQNGNVVAYGAGNPRPWEVKLIGEGDENVVYYGQTPSQSMAPMPTTNNVSNVQEEVPEYGTEDIDF